MSKKIKKNEEYPLPEGCMAIQIDEANIDLDIERRLGDTYISSFVKESPVDRYCMDARSETTLTLRASTLDDAVFLRGGPGMPSLNNKSILIIITDKE